MSRTGTPLMQQISLLTRHACCAVLFVETALQSGCELTGKDWRGLSCHWYFASPFAHVGLISNPPPPGGWHSTSARTYIYDLNNWKWHLQTSLPDVLTRVLLCGLSKWTSGIVDTDLMTSLMTPWNHHLENFKWRYLWNASSDQLRVWFLVPVVSSEWTTSRLSPTNLSV